MVKLTQVADIVNESICEYDGVKSYIATGDVDCDHVVSFTDVGFKDKPSRANITVRNGDVIVARMKDTVKVLEINDHLSGNIYSTGFAVFRPKPNKITSALLRHFLLSGEFQRQKNKHSTGATQKAVPNSGLQKVVIENLPKSLDEQRRIAKILDKADGIRKKRQKSLDALDDLLCATFLNMFGDPVTNPNNLKSKPLAKVCSFISGGTPSKSNAGFWGEGYFWVSPKDMKYDFIEKSIDQVTPKSLEQSNLKLIPVGATLIVVRGMILVHTVPIGMAVTDLTINQDIKAIVFKKDELNPMFAFWCMKVQQSSILSKVSTAAHGTKRLEMQDVESIPIILPSITEQNKFCEFVEKFRSSYQEHMSSNILSDELFKTLTQSAFKGEL